MIFNFWIFGRGVPGGNLILDLSCWGVDGWGGWRWCLNGGCVLLNSGLLSSCLFVFLPQHDNPTPKRTQHFCLLCWTTKASCMLEEIWKNTLMSSPCMLTAFSTVHFLMYVNVINNWIIIITLLVSKESDREEESGHHRAFSMKGLMCSLSYCNASVNINAT